MKRGHPYYLWMTSIPLWVAGSAIVNLPRGLNVGSGVCAEEKIQIAEDPLAFAYGSFDRFLPGIRDIFDPLRSTNMFFDTTLSRWTWLYVYDGIHIFDECRADKAREDLGFKLYGYRAALCVQEKQNPGKVNSVPLVFSSSIRDLVEDRFGLHLICSQRPRSSGKQSDACQRSGSWESHPRWVLHRLLREVSLSRCNGHRLPVAARVTVV